ncbi:MAG: hypothetical protein F6K35_47750 [Okeania sp. SIO2H7]|nr:hypothetical protein [Okeania sp. SIO2H7]
MTTNPIVKDFLNNLTAGEITLLTGIFWLGVAAALSIVGGAIGGVLLAGKDLGYRLSAMIGGLFGPVGVIPAVLLGLAVLKFAF